MKVSLNHRLINPKIFPILRKKIKDKLLTPLEIATINHTYNTINPIKTISTIHKNSQNAASLLNKKFKDINNSNYTLNTEYNELRKKNSQFTKDIQSYFKLRERGLSKDELIKQAEMPFLDITEQYKKKGLKIPNLTRGHNFFSKNPLYLTNADDINYYYFELSQINKKVIDKDDKEYSFLRRIEDNVEENILKYKIKTIGNIDISEYKDNDHLNDYNITENDYNNTTTENNFKYNTIDNERDLKRPNQLKKLDPIKSNRDINKSLKDENNQIKLDEKNQNFSLIKEAFNNKGSNLLRKQTFMANKSFLREFSKNFNKKSMSQRVLPNILETISNNNMENLYLTKLDAKYKMHLQKKINNLKKYAKLVDQMISEDNYEHKYIDHRDKKRSIKNKIIKKLENKKKSKNSVTSNNNNNNEQSNLIVIDCPKKHTKLIKYNEFISRNMSKENTNNKKELKLKLDLKQNIIDKEVNINNNSTRDGLKTEFKLRKSNSIRSIKSSKQKIKDNYLLEPNNGSCRNSFRNLNMFDPVKICDNIRAWSKKNSNVLKKSTTNNGNNVNKTNTIPQFNCYSNHSSKTEENITSNEGKTKQKINHNMLKLQNNITKSTIKTKDKRSSIPNTEFIKTGTMNSHSKDHYNMEPSTITLSNSNKINEKEESKYQAKKHARLKSLFKMALDLKRCQSDKTFIVKFKNYFSKYKGYSHKYINKKINEENKLKNFLSYAKEINNKLQQRNIGNTWKKNYLIQGILDNKKESLRKLNMVDFYIKNFEKDIIKAFQGIKKINSYECKDEDLN